MTKYRVLSPSVRPTPDLKVVYSLCITGEYDPQYAEVANTTSIPTWPINSPKRWNVLLDAVIVGDQIVTPTTTVVGAPSNKAVVLLDSGSSFTYVLTLADCEVLSYSCLVTLLKRSAMRFIAT